jgi:hypothetical protein
VRPIIEYQDVAVLEQRWPMLSGNRGRAPYSAQTGPEPRLRWTARRRNVSDLRHSLPATTEAFRLDRARPPSCRRPRRFLARAILRRRAAFNSHERFDQP